MAALLLQERRGADDGFRTRLRAAEVEALQGADAELLQGLAFLRRFYAFGDDAAADAAGNVADEAHELALDAVVEAGLAQALIAEFEGQPIAHVILLHFGRKCWYFYGASANAERERMPNYLLQWEAMRWAKANGYAVYDFWGAPDVFDESDGMWGVFNFKRGFRGVVTRHVGAWDYAPFPPLYRAYTGLWPRILARLKRRASRSET